MWIAGPISAMTPHGPWPSVPASAQQTHHCRSSSRPDVTLDLRSSSGKLACRELTFPPAAQLKPRLSCTPPVR